MAEPWFAKAFEDHYTEVYAHRDDAEAEAHLPQIIQLAQLGGCNGPILDCGCGTGRYARLLTKRGFSVLGLDYSKSLLKKAQASMSPPSLVRGDMRALPFKASFDRVLSLFTSFGYFDDDGENLEVLRQYSQSLKPNGLLYLDFFNAKMVQESDWEEKQVGNDVMRSKKEIDCHKNQVVKTIHLKFSQRESTYKEKVKLYDASWFEKNCALAGLTHLKFYGDYQGRAWQPHSPRLIIIGKKSV